MDLRRSASFFGKSVGLGAASAIGDDAVAFGSPSRGLLLKKPRRSLRKGGDGIYGDADASHVAIDVPDLHGVVSRLDRAGLSYVDAERGDLAVPAVYTLDPAGNCVAFCQAEAPVGDEVTVRDRGQDGDWDIHHVNLPASDVREAVAFFVEIVGLTEGTWRAPEARGSFSIDPSELSVLSQDDCNRGLHIIRPDDGFGLRNGFAHNPSIGGHPAIVVSDIAATRHRLEAAHHLVSDAGVYAMAGMHQLYVHDPSANVIEINQPV